MSLMVGSVRYRFPDGAPFEGVGIAPDVPVELRITDVRDGRDPVLQKAVELAAEPGQKGSGAGERRACPG
jgi:carboxyl-terminal processing protease